MKEFSEALRVVEESGLLRKLTAIDSFKGAEVVISGETFTNFGSNDYLNLSGRQEIRDAVAGAARKYGFGSGSSRLLSGTFLSHKRLEERVAEFKKTEAALVFNSGYAANTGIIPAIAGAGSMIFSDELNHASIVDGIRLSKARFKIFSHRNTAELEELLSASLEDEAVEERLVITDSVFSMDGDIAPLNEISALCRKFDARLMVDDAHGTGILGKGGRGALEHFGIEDDDIIQAGTMSKALGCYGGFVAGRKDLISYLINKARSFIFSTSLPIPVVEGAIAAFDILGKASNEMRERVLRNSAMLRAGLRDAGFDTLGSETQIIPVLTGDAKTAVKLSEYLYGNRILAFPIRPPAVPEGMCRLRFSVTAGHEESDISNLLELMKNT
ncbi:MAG: 8-amino-7-oxononanoate synthase [Nitrospirae bacterium]|nr:8-amino-7-oxononanoate synthase [Nitrospirota bacterium]